MVLLVPVSIGDHSDCKRRCAGVALLAPGMYGPGPNMITLSGVTHVGALAYSARVLTALACALRAHIVVTWD